MMQTPDSDIWKWAKQNKYIIITKDEDFVILHNADEDPCRICWVRVGNTRRKELLEWFARLLPAIKTKFESGALLVELT